MWRLYLEITNSLKIYILDVLFSVTVDSHRREEITPNLVTFSFDKLIAQRKKSIQLSLQKLPNFSFKISSAKERNKIQDIKFPSVFPSNRPAQKNAARHYTTILFLFSALYSLQSSFNPTKSKKSQKIKFPTYFPPNRPPQKNASHYTAILLLFSALNTLRKFLQPTKKSKN